VAKSGDYFVTVPLAERFGRDHPFQRFPDARLEIRGAAPRRHGGVTLHLRFAGRGARALSEATLTHYQATGALRGHEPLFALGEEQVEALVEVGPTFSTFTSAALPPRVLLPVVLQYRSIQWHFRTDREGLAPFLERVRARGHEPDVVFRAGTFPPEDPQRSADEALGDLVLALGYYDEPRRITLEAVARRLDLDVAQVRATTEQLEAQIMRTAAESFPETLLEEISLTFDPPRTPQSPKRSRRRA
jgi:hypothetical protein